MEISEEEREANAKKFLVDQAKRAIAVRSKDREFHGLEREFMYHQAQMVNDYDKSKDLKHPRDLGDSREQILRKFLKNSGLLPQRYAVSTSSARVVSPSGHISKEIDILLYDPLDSISLMGREDVYQVFPIESVYGVIQVKSRLNKNEIKDGLDNIASFKKLNRPAKQGGGFRIIQGDREELGFGLLFAYDSDLPWLDIVRQIEDYAKTQPNRNWCNGVFILNKGFILYGSDRAGMTHNSGLSKITELVMHGHPDRQNILLLQFYGTLLTLLRNTDIEPSVMSAYVSLPFVAGDESYEFSFGAFAEYAKCDKHGDFQRKITPENLSKIVDWCKQAEPINWIKATDLAMGKPGNDEQAYARQPQMVRIYNPENLPLPDILMHPEHPGAMTFDQIRSAGMEIYVPNYYTAKENLISDCPKC